MSDEVERAGFIVHSTAAMRDGRATVTLFCRGENGETFAVRDGRLRPYFFADAARRLPKRAGVTVRETDLSALHGGPVVRVEVARPHDVRQTAEAFAAAGVATFESDLRFTSRYLIDHDLKGALTVRGRPGTPEPWLHVGALYEDPEIAPAQLTPALSALSFDIETEGERVLSIALHGAGSDRVLLLRGSQTPFAPTPEVSMLDDERALLLAFVAEVRARDPDILTGWNIIDFDLSVLETRAKALGVALTLGRDESAVQIEPTRSFWNAPSATVVGRVILDGIQLLRSAFVPMEEYGLDFVARQVLGEGKTLSGPDRMHDIVRLYHADPAAFVAYNLHDARLVTGILDKLGLVALAVERSLLTGMALDRVAASIASFDQLYLPELRRRNTVAPAVHGEAVEPQQGGLVLEPEPGLYEQVLVFDFKSLYPSVIRTFQIDPLGLARADEADCIIAPNGARFRRTPGILPGILDTLFPRREAAKARGDATASHAIKILMNSLYGVLGSSSCRFYDAALAGAITGFGREILLWSKARLEGLGYRVLYGDTDSLFVLSGEKDSAAAAQKGDALLAALNSALTAHVGATWGVENKLELELDTQYHRLLLLHMRHKEAGARKRYAGLVHERGEKRVVFVGMEVVRRDWTELARRVQRELYERLFSDRPVAEYLRGVVRALLAGELDELLVYRKALRKGLDSYTANTPPHVAAARKLQGPAGRLIAYVMTVQGPEPAAERKSAIDRRHYVEKQLRPIAEPVLELLGEDFDRVTEAPGQLRLL